LARWTSPQVIECILLAEIFARSRRLMEARIKEGLWATERWIPPPQPEEEGEDPHQAKAPGKGDRAHAVAAGEPGLYIFSGISERYITDSRYT